MPVYMLAASVANQFKSFAVAFAWAKVKRALAVVVASFGGKQKQPRAGGSQPDGDNTAQYSGNYLRKILSLLGQRKRCFPSPQLSLQSIKWIAI